MAKVPGDARAFRGPLVLALVLHSLPTLFWLTVDFEEMTPSTEGTGAERVFWLGRALAGPVGWWLPSSLGVEAIGLHAALTLGAFLLHLFLLWDLGRRRWPRLLLYGFATIWWLIGSGLAGLRM